MVTHFLEDTSHTSYSESDINETRIVTLGEVAAVRTGPFGSALHESDYKRVGTPIVTVEHLSERGLTRQNLPLVGDDDVHRLAAYKCRPGDILFSRVGSIDRSAYVSTGEAGWLFSGRLLRVRVTDPQTSPLFLSYLMSTKDFKNQVQSVAVGQTMPSLNTQILKNIPVALPPLHQQISIARSLADADALVDGLERQIAKKQSIKQGMMQRLFASNDTWERSELRQIADVIDPHPSHRAPAEADKGIPFLGIGDLNVDGTLASKSFRLVSPNVLVEHATRYDLKEGLIGLGRVASIGKVVRLPQSGRDITISPTLGVIRPRSVDLDFLYYTLSSKETNAQFRKVMSGSTRASVGMEVLRRIIVWHPSSTADQQKIGRALTDVDAEIAALRVRLKKAVAIKQGMMQKLLTRRTRLSVMETAS